VTSGQLGAHQRAFEHEFSPSGAPAFASLGAALDAGGKGQVFFLALHGGAGENGTIQREFESRGLAYTASDSAASARAFDKAQAKALVGSRGARLAFAQILEPSADEAALATRLHALLAGQPRWVLKPVADGSSFGLIHVTQAAQVPSAAAQLASLKLRYLAEAFVTGRELTVGVIDEAAGPVALPVSEVRLAKDAAFDYAGKYLGQGTEEITPAVLTDLERNAAQTLALTAHQAVGCFGYSRTDMILSSDGQGPVFLEINTLPGLTRASFIPQQLAASGRPFRAFLERQVALARSRRGG
jgi:D-alanine-D-alanine ligase